MRKMTNRYAEKIKSLISPHVGDFIAKMAVESQCKALGISPEGIGPQHLEELADKFKNAMAFYGYKSEGENIANAIRGIR
jgi:hypothetical protein